MEKVKLEIIYERIRFCRTKSYNKIKQIIDRTKGIPKKKLLKELNWGIRIKWSCYRNLLREKGYKISKDYYAPVV